MGDSFRYVVRRIGTLKSLNSKAYLDEIEHAQEGYVDELLELFDSTVETWKEKPEFGVSRTRHNNEIGIVIGTNDRIYHFLNYGTKTRWAKMSRNWKSKTGTTWLKAKPGKGKVVAKGSKAMKTPQPGIEARDFTGRIYDEVRVKFRNDMRNAHKRGLRRMKKNA